VWEHKKCTTISQWQAAAKSPQYLAYRWVIATIYTLTNTFAIAVHLTTTGGTWANYFAYLTNLGNTACMFATILGAVAIMSCHRKPEHVGLVRSLQEMPSTLWLYWRWHNVALLVAIIVTSFYWTVVIRGKVLNLNISF
jgi:hypothetical protein